MWRSKDIARHYGSTDLAMESVSLEACGVNKRPMETKALVWTSLTSSCIRLIDTPGLGYLRKNCNRAARPCIATLNLRAYFC